MLKDEDFVVASDASADAYEHGLVAAAYGHDNKTGMLLKTKKMPNFIYMQ